MEFAQRHITVAETPRDDSPPGIAPSGAYLPELEGLRGLAILFVLVFHCQGATCLVVASAGQACSRGPVGLMAAGHTGVSLFFVLSAFLLSLPFFQQAAGGRTISVSHFYRRRALRILPLYWSVLVVGALVGAVVFPSTETFRRTLPYLFFVNGVWPLPLAGVHTQVMWSLATEVQFYALLPLLFLPLGTRSRPPVGILVFVLFALAYAALLLNVFVTLMGTRSWLIGLSILGRGPLFICGMAAAWLYVNAGARLRAWRPLAVGGDLLLVGSLVALELLLREVARGGFLHWEVAPYVVWHAAEGVLWTAVLLLVAIAPLRLRVLFVNPVMIRLGVLSYSIYLLHWPVLVWGGGCCARRSCSPPEWA